MTKDRLKLVIIGALSLTLGSELAATEWNVSLWGTRRAFTEHVEKMAELVSEKTNNEFNLNLSYGGLSKNTDNLEGISRGAFEMAQFCAGYHYDKNPSITVLELPFLGISSLEQGSQISQALYQHSAVVEDMARWNATLLMPSPLPQYNIVGICEAPQSLQDFAGVTVRATGGIGKVMAFIGARPTSQSATEVRQALDNRVIEAVAFAPHAHMSYGTIEIGKWWTTNLNPGTLNCPIVVNTDALASLSDKERNALLGSVDDALAHYLSHYNEQTMAKWEPILNNYGIIKVTFDESELAALRDAVAGPPHKCGLRKTRRVDCPLNHSMILSKAWSTPLDPTPHLNRDQDNQKC